MTVTLGSRVIPFVLLCALALFGIYVVYDMKTYGSDWRDLRSIHAQLRDIAQMLRRHKAVHGRYPTMDEGLSALDGFSQRFPTDGSHWEHMRLQAVAGMARAFRSRTGRWPTNQRELWEKWPGKVVTSGPPVDSLEVAISPGGVGYLLYLGEILTPFLTPYCYEGPSNGGARAAPSAASPDPLGVHSVKVDDGVLVFSPGAEVLWLERVRSRLILRVGFWVAMGLLAVWWLACWLRDRKSGEPDYAPIRKSGIAAAAVIVLLALLGRPLRGTADETGVSACRRAAHKRYAAVQRGYASGGLISEDTLDRRLRVLLLAGRHRTLAQPAQDSNTHPRGPETHPREDGCPEAPSNEGPG